MKSEAAQQAELDFFFKLQSDAPIEKEAVELDPETLALLDNTASPEELDALEEQASSAPEPVEASPEKEAPVEEAAPVGREDVPPEEEVEEEPVLPDRSSHAALFTDRRAHPIQLLEVLTMRYKTAWVEWEPETLWWTLRRDFGPLGQLTRNKIGALRVAVTTDIPWQDWDTFENCGLTWNDIIPAFGESQLMTPAQIAFSVSVLRGIRSDEEFQHEVSAYIAAILDDHGFVYAPEEWFPGTQTILDRRNWLVGFKVEVEDAWTRVQDVPIENIEWDEEDPLDMHVLKLAVVKRYLEERATMHQQLPGSTAVSVAAPPIP